MYMSIIGNLSIRPARSPEDLRDARCLFSAYATWLNVDLEFQDFNDELERLPGKYAPPQGEILLARDSNETIVGCVALRPFGSDGRTCEIKRLYVIPEARKLRLGRKLVVEIIKAAVAYGYTEMRLDTLGYMHDAIALYMKFGFTPVDAYYDTPLADTIFLARTLP